MKTNKHAVSRLKPLIMALEASGPTVLLLFSVLLPFTTVAKVVTFNPIPFSSDSLFCESSPEPFSGEVFVSSNLSPAIPLSPEPDSTSVGLVVVVEVVTGA